MSFSIRWFANDGGPLIVLPREAGAYWEGGDPPSNGRIVEAQFRYNGDPATDYDRACDVEGWASVIEIGPSWGLVLGEDAYDGWLKLDSLNAFVIVRLVYSDEYTDQEIHDLYVAQQEQNWRLLHSGLKVEQGDLLLMHAASRIQEVTEKGEDDLSLVTIGDAIPLHTKPGSYRIDICEVSVPSEAHFVFIRSAKEPYLHRARRRSDGACAAERSRAWERSRGVRAE